jgi:Tol biopolymer transport system component
MNKKAILGPSVLWALSWLHIIFTCLAVFSLAACGLAPTPTAPTTTHAVSLKKAGLPNAPAPTLQQVVPANGITPAAAIQQAAAASAQWGSAPNCENQPLTLAGWQTLLGSAAGSAGLQAESAQKSELAALQMNVISGRLNRETGIKAAGLPEIDTVGALIDQLEQANQAGSTASPALIQASQQVQTGKAITRPVCARLLVTQASSQPAEVLWSTDGVQAQAVHSAVGPTQTNALPEPVKDTGVTSPDGKKAAFTSLRVDEGGPVYTLDLQTGGWTNVIQAVNQKIKGSQPALAEDLWWEIAGWLPDSQRIALAPADLSAVFVVNINDFTYKIYGFDGGGAGGGSVVQLAPDGTRFVYLGLDPSGGQSLNVVRLDSGEDKRLAILPAQDGFMLYPRFSPDSGSIAYLVQKGHPLKGITYSINLYTFATASERVLVEGNLGPSVPTWSPDGEYIAFTKKEPDTPDLVIPDQPPAPMRGNLWITRVKDGALTQLTFIDGWARSPAWDSDARTLAFVTQTGQVGMVTIDQPGKIWLAADTSTDNPLVTSAFFVP